MQITCKKKAIEICYKRNTQLSKYNSLVREAASGCKREEVAPQGLKFASSHPVGKRIRIPWINIWTTFLNLPLEETANSKSESPPCCKALNCSLCLPRKLWQKTKDKDELEYQRAWTICFSSPRDSFFDRQQTSEAQSSPWVRAQPMFGRNRCSE